MSTLHVNENNTVIVKRLYRSIGIVLQLFIVLAIAGDSFAGAEGAELFQELRRTLRDRSSSPAFDAKCNVDRFDKKPKREYQLAWDGQFMLQSVVKNSAGGGTETSVKNSDFFLSFIKVVIVNRSSRWKNWRTHRRENKQRVSSKIASH